MADKVWTQSGKQTLLSSSDLLNPTLSTLDELFENITNQIANVGNTRAEWRFNSLATNIYATRFNQNGAGDASGASQSAGVLGNTSGNAEDNFNWFYVNNITSREKMALYRTMDAGAATSAGAPQRIKGWMKAASTTPLTSIQVTNLFGGGDFGIGSQMQVATAAPSGVAVGQLGSWVELGRTKLLVAGDTVDVASLPNKRYYLILIDTPPTTNLTTNLRLGAGSVDTGANYSSRDSQNGGADLLTTNRSSIKLQGSVSSAQQRFGVHLIANLSNKEKLHLGNDQRTIVGAGSAPTRIENTGKWTNVASPLDVIEYLNTNSGNFGIGTEVVILGWTPNDSSTTESNFWVPLAETVLAAPADDIEVLIAPKKYLWLQIFIVNSGSAGVNIAFNNDLSSVYALRRSINGLTDATFTNVSTLTLEQGVDNNSFINTFIINKQSLQKLLFSNTVSQNSAGSGNAPTRDEIVAKWANTTSLITSIAINNSLGGSYDTGSLMRVWGHD